MVLAVARGGVCLYSCEGGSYKEMEAEGAGEQQFSPLGRLVMALELGVGALKSGAGPQEALAAMTRYDGGSSGDDVGVA